MGYELKSVIKVHLDLSFADAHNDGPNGSCFSFHLLKYTFIDVFHYCQR